MAARPARGLKGRRVAPHAVPGRVRAPPPVLAGPKAAMNALDILRVARVLPLPLLGPRTALPFRILLQICKLGWMRFRPCFGVPRYPLLLITPALLPLPGVRLLRAPPGVAPALLFAVVTVSFILPPSLRIPMIQGLLLPMRPGVTPRFGLALPRAADLI